MGARRIISGASGPFASGIAGRFMLRQVSIHHESNILTQEAAVVGLVAEVVVEDLVALEEAEEDSHDTQSQKASLASPKATAADENPESTQTNSTSTHPTKN